MNSYVTPEQVEAARKRLGLKPSQTSVGFQSTQPESKVGFTRPPESAGPTPQQQKPSRGGLSGFVRRISTPLVDVPNLPGGFVGDIVEQGIESVTSPIGLVSTALIPVTGGASLGLRGAAGVAARLGTRAAAEVAAGGAAGKAAEVAGEKLKDAPGALRLAGTLGAAVAAGGVTGVAASRALRGGSEAAVKSAAATAEGMSAQSLGGFTPEADEVISALGKAKEMMADPAVMRTLKQDRGRVLSGRISAGNAAAAKTGGSADDVIRARMTNLRGELPRLEFPELSIKPETIESLRQTVLHSDKLSYFDQNNAHDALMKVLRDQTFPAPKELEMLEKVFGTAFVKAVTDIQPYTVGSAVRDLINLPRAILASMDLSQPANQGLMVAGANPREWGRSLKVTFKSFSDPAYAKESDDWVRGLTGTDEHKFWMAHASRSNQHIVGGAVKDDMYGQSNRIMEKFMANNLAGTVLDASERSYVAPGNYQRAVVYEKWAKRMATTVAKEGDTLEQTAARIPYRDMERLADTVSVITGRSTLLRDGMGAKFAPFLNATFFAPSYFLSRLQAPLLPIQSLKLAVERGGLGVLADPVALWKSDQVLQLQARSLGGFVAEGAAILAMAKVAKEAGILPDFDIEFDPRSKMFGKGKVGNHAIDFWGGYSQIASAVAQAVTGHQKSFSGVVKEIPRDDAIWDKFIRSKVAPFPGLAWDIKTGTSYTGERVEADADLLDQQIADRIMPLAMQDILRGYTEGSGKGAASAVPALIGARITSFQSMSSIKDDLAQEKFKKPYNELSQTERENVDNHSKVLDKEREWDLVTGETFGKTVDYIHFERAQTENVLASRYLTKQDDIRAFVDGVEETQLRAAVAREKAAEQFGVKPTAKTSLLDQGLQQWQGLYDQADIGAGQGIKTGQIDWDTFSQLESALFKTFTPEQVRFIEERHSAPHDPSVQWYFNNKKYINDSGYYDLADSVFATSAASKQFSSYGELLAAVDFAVRTADVREEKRLKALLKPIEDRASTQKEAMRRKDPNLDAAMIAIGRASKPQSTTAARLLAH